MKAKPPLEGLTTVRLPAMPAADASMAPTPPTVRGRDVRFVNGFVRPLPVEVSSRRAGGIG
jgi:hypothetical protein